jgi:hypothetical protein
MDCTVNGAKPERNGLHDLPNARNSFAIWNLQISGFGIKTLERQTCAKLLNTGILSSEMGRGAPPQIVPMRPMAVLRALRRPSGG